MTSVETRVAGGREWLALAVLALGTLLVAVDVFVLLLALPTLSRDLGADSNQQLWITDIYGFLLAGLLLTMGNLGDRIGRRRLLLIGAAGFGVASLLAAFSTSPEMLIVARALLGIAGATLTPSTLALITNIFQDPKQRAMAIGAWGATWTIGAIIGPIVGGVLLANFWWGSVFLIGVPAMVVLVISGPILLPEHRDPNPGRIDLFSVLLSLLTLLPIIYAIKELTRHGWQPLPLASLVLGVVCGALFFRRQHTLTSPMLDLRVFNNRIFNTSLGSLFSYSFIGGSTMLFMVLYFQLVGELSTIQAGLAMLPGALAGTVAFAITPIVARKIRPAYVMAGGLLGAVCMILLMTTASGSSGTAIIIISFAGYSFFGVPLVALGTNVVMSAAPPERGGVAGSLTQLSNEFGATLGAAVMGVIGFSVYRLLVVDTIPTEVPADAAAIARDSMAGAVSVAGDLPGPVADNLLAQARDSFASGLHTVIIINAVIMTCMALLIATMLRHLPPIGQAAPVPGGSPEPAAAGDRGTAASESAEQPEATAPAGGD